MYKTSFGNNMSRGNRGLITTLVRNFLDSIKPRQASGKLMGTDYLGNSYYEVKPSFQQTRSRPSRYYVPKDSDVAKFDEPLPAEWEAWLRLRRREPPTSEEVETNLRLLMSKKSKADAIDKQFKEPDDEEQVTTGIKNFPSYNEYELYPGKGPSGK